MIRFSKAELENLVAGYESNLNPIVPDLEIWVRANGKISKALERMNRG